MWATARTGLGLALVVGAGGRAQPAFHDAFDDITPWSLISSEGVQASIALADGFEGKGLRLNYDFRTGAGYCVVRRRVGLPLPANYRFSFQIRGKSPVNTLEFKLVDPSGDNVWWVNRRDFEFPAEWRRVAYQARHFRFAWGPSAGKPLSEVGYVEIAVTASTGGRGTVWLDELAFEPLPPPSDAPPRVRASSWREGGPTEAIPLPADGRFNWANAPSDPAPWIEIDLTESADVGGLVVEWDKDDFATNYQVQVAIREGVWHPIVEIKGCNGGRDYLPLSDVEGRRIRLAVSQLRPPRSIVAVRRLHVMGPEFGESPNALMKVVAADAPRGWYPEYFRDRQVPWTVVGAAGDDREALLDVHGAVEVHKLGFRIEPFLMLDPRLVTWADASITQSLAEDYLPIPTVTWIVGDLKMEITAFTDGSPGDACLLVRYHLSSSSLEWRFPHLTLAIRPFQVLPPWHELNVTGGVSPIDSIRLERSSEFRGELAPLDRVVIKGRRETTVVVTPGEFCATAFQDGEIIEHLAARRMSSELEVRDPQRLASGAIRTTVRVGAGESAAVVVAVPLHDRLPDWLSLDDPGKAARQVDERLEKCADEWKKTLNPVQLSLPPSAKKLADTFRTVQAHILINADGPAIQPGSRTYERSWIRDGALTSAALLSTGHAEQAKAFLDWYSTYQFPGGKIPCVVDRRGPDPVAEHDSTGEWIFALHNYYLFTGDRAVLERHFDRLTAAVDYLDSLRQRRLTDEYRDGPPEKRACYGLVPESISHEGYSAKPMHSYWDDFFVLKGFEDAADIASRLGKPDLATKWSGFRDEFKTHLYASIHLAMQTKGIDYIPGCVELGDFDATSTAIGLFPCGQLGSIPEPQLGNTFERYYDFFVKRRANRSPWDGFTPYEIRVVGTFVRLGRPDRAHELLDFFLGYQSPVPWNQWPEVSYRDPLAPRFAGDIPHTWVGSEFINAFRSLFVYEAGDQLELLAGIKPEWLDEPGIELKNWPTHFGKLDLRARREATGLTVRLAGDAIPPAGCRIRLPTEQPPSQVLWNGREMADDQAGALRLPDCIGALQVQWAPAGP